MGWVLLLGIELIIILDSYSRSLESEYRYRHARVFDFIGMLNGGPLLPIKWG